LFAAALAQGLVTTAVHPATIIVTIVANPTPILAALILETGLLAPVVPARAVIPAWFV
jgi:hypothetical protein